MLLHERYAGRRRLHSRLMNGAVLLLGGDLGDPRRTLDLAQEAIARAIGPVRACSRDHWTVPWGFAGTRLFLNRALEVDTGQLGAAEVLRRCLLIEEEFGRVRKEEVGYASRTLDVDILFMDGLVREAPDPILPHPRVHLRRFALGPVADILPGLVHPLLGVPVLRMLDRLEPDAAL